MPDLSIEIRYKFKLHRGFGIGIWNTFRTKEGNHKCLTIMLGPLWFNTWIERQDNERN